MEQAHLVAFKIKNHSVLILFYKIIDQSDSYGNDEEYDFGFNLANYNFKDTNNPATTNPIKVEKVNSLKV